jgi:hypothetical protein
MVMLRRAVIAVLVMIVVFPVVVIVTGEMAGGSIVGESLGGLMLAYASLPVIATVVAVGSIPQLRPRWGVVGTAAWVAVVGGVIAVVFATTLYNGGHPFAGLGVWYWWVAAMTGLAVLWRR